MYIPNYWYLKAEVYVHSKLLISQSWSICTFQTSDISKLKYMFISNFWYLKVNFLVPENLLWDISSLWFQGLKCKSKREICQNYILWYKSKFWDISVWDIRSWLCHKNSKYLEQIGSDKVCRFISPDGSSFWKLFWKGGTLTKHVIGISAPKIAASVWPNIPLQKKKNKVCITCIKYIHIHNRNYFFLVFYACVNANESLRNYIKPKGFMLCESDAVIYLLVKSTKMNFFLTSQTWSSRLYLKIVSSFYNFITLITTDVKTRVTFIMFCMSDCYIMMYSFKDQQVF